VRCVSKPSDDAKQVFLACARRVRRRRLRAMLLRIAARVEQEALSFEEAAAAQRVHLITGHDSVGRGVTSREMRRLYKQQLVAREAPGRALYDRLLAAAPLGLCPLCAQGVAGTLDHYLPASKFPALAVVPCNLVPACGRCNTVKGNTISNVPGEQTIHPYFDNVERDIWLFATVVPGESPALQFFARPPPNWPSRLGVRVCHHFRVFQLGKLYAVLAASELAGIHHRLEALFMRGGPARVRKHLREEARSRRASHANSWQGAMYDALAQSDWFCTEGVL
jgi:5-methylcytosine-specific restriction endonuclease McrA